MNPDFLGDVISLTSIYSQSYEQEEDIRDNGIVSLFESILFLVQIIKNIP